MPHLQDMFLGKEILFASETNLVHAESKLRSNCKVLKSESSQRGLPTPLWWSETFARQVVFQRVHDCLKAVGSDEVWFLSVCHADSIKIMELRTSALLHLNLKCQVLWGFLSSVHLLSGSHEIYECETNGKMFFANIKKWWLAIMSFHHFPGSCLWAIWMIQSLM